MKLCNSLKVVSKSRGELTSDQKRVWLLARMVGSLITLVTILSSSALVIVPWMRLKKALTEILSPATSLSSTQRHSRICKNNQRRFGANRFLKIHANKQDLNTFHRSRFLQIQQPQNNQTHTIILQIHEFQRRTNRIKDSISSIEHKSERNQTKSLKNRESTTCKQNPIANENRNRNRLNYSSVSTRKIS